MLVTNRGAGVSTTLQSTYRDRAVSLLGLSPANAVEDFDDYVRSNADPWTDAAGGAGSATGPVTAEGGGVWYLESGTGGGNRQQAAEGSFITTTTTKKWYFAVRMKCGTTAAAGAHYAFGFRNYTGGGNSLVVGVVGSLDASNFIVQHSGDFAGSHVDLAASDTNYHIFEVWCLGDSVIHARMDGGAEVTATQSVACTSAQLYRRALDGGTTNRRLSVDWHYAMGER